jgi:4'-phosphopantetheinyl transferase EntD
VDAWPISEKDLRGLPVGVRGAAVRFAVGDCFVLDPEEERLAVDMGRARRADFAAGRTCARTALAQVGASGAVLTGADGAALWPAGVCGSISHKDGLAAALVGDARVIGAVGIDLELAQPLAPVAWGSVLTPGELGAIRGAIPGAARDAGLSARVAFSAKEAYYKWFRSSGQTAPVGFHDIRVRREGGALRFRSELPGRFPEPRGACVRMGGWLLTVAWSDAGAAR